MCLAEFKAQREAVWAEMPLGWTLVAAGAGRAAAVGGGHPMLSFWLGASREEQDGAGEMCP